MKSTLVPVFDFDTHEYVKGDPLEHIPIRATKIIFKNTGSYIVFVEGYAIAPGGWEKFDVEAPAIIDHQFSVRFDKTNLWEQLSDTVKKMVCNGERVRVDKMVLQSFEHIKIDNDGWSSSK